MARVAKTAKKVQRGNFDKHPLQLVLSGLENDCQQMWCVFFIINTVLPRLSGPRFRPKNKKIFGVAVKFY